MKGRGFVGPRHEGNILEEGQGGFRDREAGGVRGRHEVRLVN